MDISLVTLGDPHRITGGYLYHQRMADLAEAHGARVSFVSLPDDPVAQITETDLLSEVYLLHRRPDVLVIDSIVAAKSAGWLETGLPFGVVGSVHQKPGGTSGDETQRNLDLDAYRKMDLLLVASQSLVAELEAAEIDRDLIRVIPPGRDVGARGDYSGDPLEREEKRQVLRRGRRAALLCVANWEPHKGILPLLDSFEMLPDKAATLHLAGDDNLVSAYSAVVRERLERPRLAERVVVHGVVSPDEMAALYEGADIFVLPSSQDAYATAVGEAMAMALPVVGWRAGNLPSLAEDGVEGRVILEGDISGMAKALLDLVGDPEERQRLGRNAMDRASERPTWAESAEGWFGAIRKVASSSPRTRNQTPKP